MITVSKTYKIVANEQMLEEWLRVSVGTMLKMHGARILQNDMELTGGQLNDWYEHCGELIEETEQQFANVIKEMKRLRLDTVHYIKKINS